MPKIDGSSDYLIYEMTLEGNNLQSIPADAFKGLKIQRLDLRNNRLTSIDANAFSGLESDLMELYIVRGDREANVAPPLDSMTNLTGLHTLTLEHFHFNGGSSLTTISLSGNQIATMDSQSLAGLSVLQTPGPQPTNDRI
nr:hypothetical protein BaRGS_006905 [Batillaria attramentaria]